MELLERIKNLVEFAYDNVLLYRRLYRDKPKIGDMGDFQRLSYVVRGDFSMCGIQDILADLDEAAFILPPIENKTVFPFPRLESAEDRDNRYRVFHFLLEKSGVMEGCSFLIISDARHSYYCGEIANNLLYYGHPTWMMLLRDHSSDEVQAWIKKFEPDCLLLGLDRIPEGLVSWGVENIFTINQYDRDMWLTDGISHFDIYAVTEIGWIGIRLPGRQYIYSDKYFHIEADPRDNILTLTTLGSWLQPFIRYKSPDRGILLEDNNLQVTYIGEH